jgi:hypothetical protein
MARVCYNRYFFFYVMIIVALFLILNKYLFSSRESFVNIPIPTIPNGTTGNDTSKLNTLNANWRMILQYLSENPEKAGPFVADVREKFFNVDACPIKSPRIDFKMLPDLYRPVFL